MKTSYSSIYSAEDKRELLNNINSGLNSTFGFEDLDKIYIIISEIFGKLINKDFKQSKITLKKLTKTNYILNIVCNYGKLDEYPASLIHFKTFNSDKIKTHRISILKKVLKNKKLSKKVSF